MAKIIIIPPGGEKDKPLNAKEAKSEFSKAAKEVEDILEQSYALDRDIQKLRDQKSELSHKLEAAIERQNEAERTHAEAVRSANGEKRTVQEAMIGQAVTTEGVPTNG